jgi:hypothetical protein
MRCLTRSRTLRQGVLLAALALALSGMATSTAGAEQTPNPSSAPALPSTGRQPAQQSPLSPSQCGYGWACFWQDVSWSGSFWAWYQPVNQWFYVGSGANDRFSSDWNRRTTGTYVNKDWGPGTYQYCTSAGGSHEFYQYYPQPPYPEVNDSISAVYLANWGC